jgi:hypothetical protein
MEGRGGGGGEAQGVADPKKRHFHIIRIVCKLAHFETLEMKVTAISRHAIHKFCRLSWNRRNGNR